MNQLNIPIIYSRIISAAVGRNKGAMNDVLASAGLNQHSAGYMSMDQYEKLLRSAREISGDPLIAFHAGANLPFSAHGPLGIAAVSAATVNQAITALAQYAKLRIPFGKITIDKQNGMAAILFELEVSLGEETDSAIDFVMASVASSFPSIITTPLTHCTIEFDRPEPTNAFDYRKSCPIPIYFNAPRNAIVIAESDLDIELLGANEEEYQKAIDRLRSQYQPNNTQTNLEEHLNRFFSENLGHICTLEDVAENLFVTPRTLQRRLKAQNLNFQAIRDNWLGEQAKYYLSIERLSVEVTANLLGYSDPSNFRRFFKRHFQLLPSEL